MLVSSPSSPILGQEVPKVANSFFNSKELNSSGFLNTESWLPSGFLLLGGSLNGANCSDSCGDNLCFVGGGLPPNCDPETVSNCAIDCAVCGDNICSPGAGENHVSCSQDCDAPPPDPKTNPSPPSAVELGKCKLISIDSVVNIGTPFAASWLGILESIRFRQLGAGLNFISPLSGSIHWENGFRAGDFSPFGLDRGRWEASCWGAGGTFGTPLIVFVK